MHDVYTNELLEIGYKEVVFAVQLDLLVIKFLTACHKYGLLSE